MAIDTVDKRRRAGSLQEFPILPLAGGTVTTTDREVIGDGYPFGLSNIVISDTATASDTFRIFKTLYRTFKDTVSATDSFLLSPNSKGVISDSCHAIDQFRTFAVYCRKLHDTCAAIDNLKTFKSKNIKDSVLTSDRLYFHLGKNITDSVSPIDSFIRSFVSKKTIYDSVKAIDTFSAVLIPKGNHDIKDVVFASDTFRIFRKIFLRISDSVKAADVVSVDIQEKEFFGRFILTRESQKDIPLKFNLSALNLTNDFYAKMALQSTESSDFYGKFTLAKSATRITLNPALIPSFPAVSGVGNITNPIALTINPLVTSGNNLNWSVIAATKGNAVFTLDKIMVSLVGAQNTVPISGVTPTRRYIWDRNTQPYAAGQKFGDTYYNTLIPTSGGNTFSGTFPSLTTGKFQVLVESLQRQTGNRYQAVSGFTCGSFPYIVNMSGQPNFGDAGVTVNFTSNRGDVNSTKTKRIYWSFADSQSIIVPSGNNISYTYLAPSLYIPMVTYEMADGVVVSEALPRLYAEG